MADQSNAGSEPARDRILWAARTLFAGRGINGTSVDDILAASATGKSQLYHYFGSKEGLVREVLYQHAAELIDQRLDLLSALDTWEGIEAWFDWLAAQQDSRTPGGSPLGAMASELAGDDDGLRRELEAIYDHLVGYVARGLSRMQSRGLIRAGADVPSVAQFVVAGIEGGLFSVRVSGDPERLKRVLAQLLAYLRSLATS